MVSFSFSLSLFLQATASIPLVGFSLCSHTVVLKEDRAGVALIWVMVDGNQGRCDSSLVYCNAAEGKTRVRGF